MQTVQAAMLPLDATVRLDRVTPLRRLTRPALGRARQVAARGRWALAALLVAWGIAAAAPPAPDEPPQLSPLTLRSVDPVVPVLGADGATHVAYELTVANLTGGRVAIDALAVVDAADGTVVRAYDAAEAGRRLVVRDRAATPGVLGPSQTGILYLHVAFPAGRALPSALAHRLTATAAGGPPVVVEAARIAPAAPTDLILDAPLQGSGYLAGDGCCESTRHLRASLPIGGAVHTAQRFAIDWEQLDGDGRIQHGDPADPASYTIYGKPVYAVADARVDFVRDDLRDTPPGALPAGMTLADADGNSIVLDLGGGRHALYAHLKPGSVRVARGDRVRRGQLLGQVGTSGNSSEPHLHFHVMDGASPLVSDGLPYRLRTFRASTRGTSTAAFDQAILDGRPMPREPLDGSPLRTSALPLDLWVVDFPD